jgi:AGZA family xanthine/uracil permease-like MFS transporter
LAFLFVDIFDTAGTLIGVGRLAGFVDQDGELPRADRAFTADAVGTIVGAALGTSTVTSYVESATGVEEGGRTGLTAVVVAVLFLLSLFLTPLLVAVPSAATAPALILVGALMMRGARDLDWSRTDEAVPAFLTLAAMPFTYSIANGISLGIVSHVLIRVLRGRFREVHPLMVVLAALLIAFYGLRTSG